MRSSFVANDSSLGLGPSSSSYKVEKGITRSKSINSESKAESSSYTYIPFRKLFPIASKDERQLLLPPTFRPLSFFSPSHCCCTSFLYSPYLCVGSSPLTAVSAP